MAAPQRNVCPARDSVEALAHDRETATARADIWDHLTTCEQCRTLFRRITNGWFPHVRNYTILEQVGKGGFGVVYRAIHHQKRRIEALKIHFGKTPLREEYFKREVQLIAALRHANIATLYETNLSAEQPYYTMEFVEGKQLGEFLRTNALPLEERIKLVRTVVQTIGYAHSRGVIHRDIKPQNILIDATGAPRLLDFGIAKKLGLTEPFDELGGQASPEMPEGPIGTFGYIAPEQMKDGRADERADIYALGALLFHCVTGEPAKWATREDRLSTFLRERHVSRPTDLAAIIARCVQREPERRYQTCDAMDRDLENYISSKPIIGRENPPIGYKLVRGFAYALRHHPFAIRAPLLMAAAMMLAFVWTYWDLRYFVTPPATEEVRVIATSDNTIRALQDGSLAAPAGVVPTEERTWRPLHTELLRRLATAKPRVIAFDYYFKLPQPASDEALANAIRAVGAPVIIGAADFDRDGEPVLHTQGISDAAHAVATLTCVKPASMQDEFLPVIAVQTGGAPPYPGLGTATFAAARFPDCRAHYSLINQHELEIRYQRLQPSPEQPRWRAETDRLPIRDIDRNPLGQLLRAHDHVYRGAVRAGPSGYWEKRATPYVDALQASDEELRELFGGKVVLVCSMRHGNNDEWPRPDGTWIFGAEIQATTMQSFLNRSMPVIMSRIDITIRALSWCMVGGFLAIAARRAIGKLSVPMALAVGPIMMMIGLIWAKAIGQLSLERLTVETGMAIAAILLTGGMAFVLESLRERQLQLAPGTSWSTEDSTLSTTMFTETVADGRSGKQ